MKPIKLAMLALFAAFLAMAPAHAQVSVVANCSVLSPTQPAGSTGGQLTVDVNGILCATQTPYPLGATPIAAVGTGTTGAVTATLANVATKTTYICGFDVSAIGGTAAVGPVTVSNLVGAVTFTYQMASTASGTNFTKQFNPCIPAKDTSSAIAVATTADGTASAVDVNAYGYQF